jgi:hypothetical protein
MDAKLIRERLDEAQRELNTLQERQDALVAIVKSYETLLRLDGGLNGGTTQQPPLITVPTSSGFSGTRYVPETKGLISINRGIMTALRNAQGEPLHTKELLNRIVALGARTEAKNPVGAIDLQCYHLLKAGIIKKVGPRLWAWDVVAAAQRDRQGVEL